MWPFVMLQARFSLHMDSSKNGLLVTKNTDNDTAQQTFSDVKD